jgi:hypothetical protein
VPHLGLGTLSSLPGLWLVNSKDREAMLALDDSAEGVLGEANAQRESAGLEVGRGSFGGVKAGP